VSTRTIRKPPRPRLYECSTHGKHQPIYISCLCVLKSMFPVAHLIHPTERRTGELLCDKKGRHEKFELVPYCARCADEQGMNRMGAVLGGSVVAL
jgi:hypothetical protein